jgi:uncharacterized membrane protein YkoI
MPLAMTMSLFSVMSAALALAAGASAPVFVPVQQYRADQDAARSARLAGRLLPLREIERRVVPQMNGAQYIGFDFDSGSGIYTLKFLRNGNVIWVTVDGRSGAILGRTGR